MTDPFDNSEGRCWSCGYLLRGVESPQCPECGQPFDRADRATMNFGRPMGRHARIAVGPLGRTPLLLAAAGVALIAATVRWPVEGWRFSLIDVPYYAEIWQWRADRQLPASWIDLAYSAGLWAIFLAVAYWLLRTVIRAIVISRFKPPPFQRGRFWRRSVAVAGIVTVAVAGMAVGWPYRLGQRWAREHAAVPPGAVLMSPSFAQGWLRADPERYEAMIRAAVRYGSPPAKTRALKLLIEHRLDDQFLRRAAAAERDPTVKALEVRLLGLRRVIDAGPWLVETLGHPDPAVRAAAADGLGMIRAPAYQLADGRWEPLKTVTDPPITVISPWSNDRVGAEPSRLPPAARPALERMMLTGATQAEREAAARALVNWPPPKYRLRLAEWGVWQSTATPGELAMIKQQLDSIPPFVHRTGNPAAEFAPRIRPATMVWKPVIHLSTDAPLAVDLQVTIRGGRPWFAYPQPDDFVLHPGAGHAWPGTAGRIGPSGIGIERHDRADVGRLTDLRTGYPWLTPAHPTYQDNTWPGRTGRNTFDTSTSRQGMGLRWQSLIVTPQPPQGLKPPVVLAPHHRWWSSLRNVDCAWVTSRGETEKFLYYDGPASVAFERLPRLKDGRLSWHILQPASPSLRTGMLIEVKGRTTCAGVINDLETAVERRSAPIETLLNQHGTAKSAEDALRQTLLDRGLKPDEAAGLLDCWRSTFFETEGTRLLTIFSDRDYDEACPLVVRPSPTETVRVGVVFTDLPGGG